MTQGTPRFTPQGIVYDRDQGPEPLTAAQPKLPAIRRTYRYSISDGKDDQIGHIQARVINGALWFTDLWVHPDHRRRSYATALIIEALSDWGHRDIYLTVEPYTDQPMDSGALEQFYHSFDFETTGVPGVMKRDAEM